MQIRQQLLPVKLEMALHAREEKRTETQLDAICEVLQRQALWKELGSAVMRQAARYCKLLMIPSGAEPKVVHGHPHDSYLLVLFGEICEMTDDPNVIAKRNSVHAPVANFAENERRMTLRTAQEITAIEEKRLSSRGEVFKQLKLAVKALQDPAQEMKPIDELPSIGPPAKKEPTVGLKSKQLLQQAQGCRPRKEVHKLRHHHNNSSHLFSHSVDDKDKEHKERRHQGKAGFWAIFSGFLGGSGFVDIRATPDLGRVQFLAGPKKASKPFGTQITRCPLTTSPKVTGISNR